MSARQSDDDEDPPSVSSDTLGGDQEQQPQVEMGQQLILSRLGQEEGMDTDSKDLAPARINFGMKEFKESEKVLTIEDSMRRVLNLGGDKSTRPKRHKRAKEKIDKGYVGTTKIHPTSANTSNVRKKNDINKGRTDSVKNNTTINPSTNELLKACEKSVPTLPSNTSPSNTFTLSNLPNQTTSLKTENKSSGLSLNSLAKLHLSGENPPASTSVGFTLRSLGEQHLSAVSMSTTATCGQQPTSTTGFSLQKLSGSVPKSGLSLGSLATQHLAPDVTTSQLSAPSLSRLSQEQQPLSGLTTKFTIPSLFGPKPVPQPSFPSPDPAPIPEPRSTTPDTDIDLMSALRLSSPPRDIETLVAKPEDPTIPTVTEITNHGLDAIRTTVRKRRSSAFGSVVCRKWVRVSAGEIVTIVRPSQEVPGFKFDVPSPDEAVLAAQARVFNRPNNKKTISATS